MTVCDIHIHTNFSLDSSIDIEKLIKRSKKLKLDIICITDHNIYEENESIEYYNTKDGPLIVRGVELNTKQGEVLIFGLENNFWKENYPDLREVLEKVKAFNGVAIWAHPFRNYDLLKTNFLDFDINIMETLNGANSSDLNQDADNFAKKYNFKSVGGSDAHSIKSVGRSLTLFKNKITCVDDFIKELKEKSYIPITLDDYKSKDLSKLL